MELKDILQQMIAQTVEAGAPVDLVFGTVTNASPLEISINPQMAALRSPVLVLTWPVIAHEVQLPNVTIPDIGTVDLGKVQITRALQKGDRVILLRVQKGQKFLVLSRVEGG